MQQPTAVINERRLIRYMQQLIIEMVKALYELRF